MRILLTNEYLDQRPGSDAATRELSRALQRAGHFVVAYSSGMDTRERLQEHDAIAVTTDLDNIPYRPDVIHARHHLDAMTAVMALPGVPAIVHCTAPLGPPVLPIHPRIYRYVVSSERVARRLCESGDVAPSAVDVLPSAVEMSRCVRRRDRAAPPRRALVYDADRWPDSPVVREIEAAGAAMGIAVEVMGRRAGHAVENPELHLPEYDVVFAMGKAAVEALACGCSVIVLGESGCGQLARVDDWEALHRSDFVAPADAPCSAEAIRAQLERCAAGADVALLEKIREHADLAKQVMAIEGIYRTAIMLNERSAANPGAEERAVSGYLDRLVAAIKGVDDVQRASDIPISTAAMWLDASASLLALKAEKERPQW